MTRTLAVDGGQSALRVALVRDGRVVGSTCADGFDAIAATDPVAAQADAVGLTVRSLGPEGPVTRICLGLTGFPASTSDRERLGRTLSDRLGCDEVLLTSDVVTSHAGALGEPGVVLVAGCGSTCLGIGPSGRTHVAGGHGFLLGDQGSGFAIGQAGLRAAMASVDGTGPGTALVDTASDAFGSLATLRDLVYAGGSPVRLVAGFVPAVAAAARAGDTVALDIWRDAVEYLVACAIAVATRVFPDAPPRTVPVSYSGGLFQAHDLLLEPFVDLIRTRYPAADVRGPVGDSLHGATRLASHGPGMYQPFLSTTGLATSS